MQTEVVLGWTFAKDVTIDGKVPKCTPDEVERLLKRFPFIADQIDAVAGNRASFLKG